MLNTIALPQYKVLVTATNTSLLKYLIYFVLVLCLVVTMDDWGLLPGKWTLMYLQLTCMEDVVDLSESRWQAKSVGNGADFGLDLKGSKVFGCQLA